MMRDTELVLDAQDVAREILALLAVEAGGGLVEQHHLRLHGERAREADDLLDPEWQRVDRLVAEALKLDEFEHLFHRVPVHVLGGAHARQEECLGEEAGVDVRVARDEQVLDHAHVRKQLAVLEGAGDAEARNAMRPHTGDVFACETDATGARAIQAADAVQYRSLAGAVRSDQREQFAGLRLEGYVLEHLQPAEGERDGVELQRGGLSHTSAGSCGTA